MNQSISYSFLLNIIILFIFVVAAVVGGTLSYYRAFKANSIIVNEIEKYEGFNCLSESSINRKLQGVSYNVPFNVECKTSYGEPCVTDDAKNYAVVAYNLDFSNGDYINQGLVSYYSLGKYATMNSKYTCAKDKDTGKDDITNCVNSKKYQYGVYTYMYVDLPIVSSLLRIPVYSKTKPMYEFRDFYILAGSHKAYDSRFLPDGWLDLGNANGFNAHYFASYLQNEYVDSLSKLEDSKNGLRFYDLYNSRENFQKFSFDISIVDSGYDLKCGNIIDYSKY